MNRPFRTASLLTLIFTFVALWFAFVTSGDEPSASDWPLSWISPVLMTLFLMGALFLAELMLASTRGTGWQAGSAGTVTMLAALIAVGALLGLMFSLRAVLWGGPAWRRWAIVGLVTAAVLAGSGRALGCAVLAGLVWGALGMWAGAGQEPTGRVDLLLTGWMVGTTLGAVGGDAVDRNHQQAPLRVGGEER